jgi:hypothetical protein
MGQMSLFSRSEIAGMRDRTKSRSYSAEGDEFRREHERHRAWGLQQRHAAKLSRLRRSRSAPPAAPNADTVPERPATTASSPPVPGALRPSPAPQPAPPPSPQPPPATARVGHPRTPVRTSPPAGLASGQVRSPRTPPPPPRAARPAAPASSPPTPRPARRVPRRTASAQRPAWPLTSRSEG